jgi:hypothetical protein
MSERTQAERRKGTGGHDGGPRVWGRRWHESREAAEVMPTPMLVLAGKDAAAKRDHLLSDAIECVLVDRAITDGRGTVGRAVADVAGRGLAALWEHGWQPVELVRAVRRDRTARHGDLLVAALAGPVAWAGAGGAAPPPRWAAQLQELGVPSEPPPGGDWLSGWSGRTGRPWPEALAVALEALAALSQLPPLEEVVPPPSRWGTWVPGGGVVDGDVLSKVRALLAKAESTSFEAEAEALTAKAQALMTRHAIDEAVARVRHPDGATRPQARRFSIEDPYASAKSLLLAGVASANGGRTVWRPGLALMTVVAHDTELDAIDTLFTSLLVQADKALVAAGAQRSGRGRSRTRSFRQSFLVAFADRIRERLAEAAAEAAHEAAGDLATSVLPVLARRQEEVDAAVDEMFPRLSTRQGPRVTNGEGWAAGRTAADLAHLGPGTAVGPSRPPHRRPVHPPGLAARSRS